MNFRHDLSSHSESISDSTNNHEVNLALLGLGFMFMSSLIFVIKNHYSTIRSSFFKGAPGSELIKALQRYTDLVYQQEGELADIHRSLIQCCDDFSAAIKQKKQHHEKLIHEDKSETVRLQQITRLTDDVEKQVILQMLGDYPVLSANADLDEIESIYQQRIDHHHQLKLYVSTYLEKAQSKLIL